MKVTGKTEGGDFSLTLPKPGMHQAVLTHVVDLGTQPNNFDNEKPQLKVRLSFEIHDTVYKTESGEEKPVSASIELTQSLHPKAKLNQFLTGLLGRALTEKEISEGFDLFVLLKNESNNFMLNTGVTTSKDGKRSYTKILSGAPLMDGLTPLKPKLERIKFDFTDTKTGTFIYGQQIIKDDMVATFEAMPKYLQDKIRLSEEFVSVFGKSKVQQEDEEFPVGAQSDEEVF